MGIKNNIVYDKAFMFAVRIVKLSRYLSKNEKEYELANQILRSGTSIGANIREGIEAQSRKDFISKLSIALKEAAETEYWLSLLIAAEVIKEEKVNELVKESKEIIKLLNSIIKKSKDNNYQYGIKEDCEELSDE